MKFFHGLFAAFLIAGFLFFPIPASADTEAQKFLEGIYKRYVGADTPSVQLDTREALLAYFTPEVADMIAADSDRAQKAEEPPTLDGDPFVGAQDWDVKDVKVSVRDTAQGKAIGVVTFKNFGEPQTVELMLMKLPAGWRIDNIRWADGNLRDIFKDGGGGNENAPPTTQKL